jgi:hypothetical protein
MSQARWTYDPSITIGGWWIRFLWGVTFKPKRFRYSRFYGHTLVAVRLWRSPNSRKLARLVGVQWRRAEGHDVRVNVWRGSHR